MTFSEKIDTIKILSSKIIRDTTSFFPEGSSALLMQDLTDLALDIEALLHTKKQIDRLAPRFLIRRWGFASFRMALHKINKAKGFTFSHENDFVRQAHFSALWARQACDLFGITEFLQKTVRSLEHYTLYTSHLEKGDVIVSYKTNKYLNFSHLSKIIAFSENSHITHAFMVTGDEKPHTLISFNPTHGGLGPTTTSPLKGEMFIVLRYRSSVSGIPQEKIIESLDSWWPKKQAKKVYGSLSFAELKSWVACAIGFIYIVSAYLFGRPLCLPNPVKNKDNLFCSEFVDEVFKQAGVYLSPRSEDSSVVGPIELFYSPHLEFKGIIFHKEDQFQLLEEIVKTVTLFLALGDVKDVVI